MQRRKFLGLCAGAGLVAAASLCLREKNSFSDDEDFADLEFLKAADQILLTALIPIFVGRVDAQQDLLAPRQIAQIIQSINALVLRLPQRSRDELRELFDLLTGDATRLISAGVWDNWQQASSDAKQAFLRRWRDSWFQLFQKAYHGLHQIILGAFYAEEPSWAILDYPGPPKFSS